MFSKEKINMKLVAMLRIKNEIETIDDCLSNLSPLVDEIVVLDNGSTDGTLEKYNQFKKVIKVIKTEGFDEGRDKILLLNEVKKRNPDWIIWIDGDEVFEKSFTRKEVEKYMKCKHDRVAFRLCHFWLNKTHCRFDGRWFLYSLNPRARIMWRNIPSTYFDNLKIHNGLIQGINSKILYSPFRVKHFGYINPVKIRTKYNLYTKVDQGKEVGYYDHLNPDAKAWCYRFKDNGKVSIVFNKFTFSFVLTNVLRLLEKTGVSNLFVKLLKKVNDKIK